MKKLFAGIVLTLAMIIGGGTVSAASGFVELPNMRAVDEHKSFTVTFNTEIALDSVNNDTVYVTNEDGEHLESYVGLTADQKRIIVAPTEPYEAGANYTIYVTDGITSDKGVQANTGYMMDFTVATGEGGGPFIK